MRWHLNLVFKYVEVKGRASQGHTTVNKRKDRAYFGSG